MTSRSFVSVLLVVACGFALTSVATAGGPWPRLPGHFFTSTYYYLYATEAGWNAQGERIDFQNDGSYVGHTVGLYWEYGLTSRWTLEGNFPFVFDRYDDAFLAKSNAAFSDLGVAVRYYLGDDPVASSLRLGLTVPWLYGDGEPERGFGEYSVEAGAAVGRGFGGRFTGWWRLDANYRHYFGDAIDQIRYEALLGVDLHENWSVIGQINGTQAIGDSEPVSRFNPTVQDGYSFLRAQVSGVYHAPGPASVQLGLYKDLYGRNFGIGQGVTAAIWIEF